MLYDRGILRLILITSLILLVGPPSVRAVFSPPIAHAQVGIAANPTAVFVVDQLAGRVNELIKQAEMSGDYLMAQALRNILTLLDNFKLAAGDILDKTFDGLEAQQKTFFNNIEGLLSLATEDSSKLIGEVQEITDQAYAIINDLPFGKDKYIILRYSPSHIVWEANREIKLKVSGLNIGLSSPVLRIGDQAFTPVSLRNTEAIFNIPTDFVKQPFDDYIVISATVDLHKNGWFRDKTFTYPIELKYAPRIFGKINDIQFVGDQTFIEFSNLHRREAGFEGRDQTISITQTPVGGEGWRIDPSSITYKKTSGEASDPLYMEGPATPAGFTMAMKCLQYYQGLSEKPGYGIGWWTWREIKTTNNSNVTKPYNVEAFIHLGFTSVIKLPSSEDSVAGTFTNFRGQTTYLNGSFSSSPLANMRLEGQNLILTPKYQQDSYPRTSGQPYHADLMELYNEAKRQYYSNFANFLAVFDEALTLSEESLGEEIFEGLSKEQFYLDFGTMSTANSTTFTFLREKMKMLESLVDTANNPATDDLAKYNILSTVSRILNKESLHQRIERISLFEEQQ